MADLPQWAQRGRGGWRYFGQERPSFARSTGPGQESVWDYPRPPRLSPDARRVTVHAGELLIADTRGALRLLETASPPTFYLPPADVDSTRLVAVSGGTRCEWKGLAQYYDVLLADGRRLQRAAWSYPEPFGDFTALAGYLAFYPSLLRCAVDGERVRPQPGRFYGGWVTDELVGPFKGEPGSGGW